MIPQERDLIESVFSRLAQTASAPKDPEALALINERIRALPDAAYGLVQAVLVQENIIKQAQAHIAELEQRLAQAPAAAPTSFLGAAPANPWGPKPAQQQQQQQPVYQPQPAFAPQQAAPQQASAWGQAPVAGGGFLRQAATAAAGVAGGMLVAEGISSLFSGHHGGFGGGGFGGGYDQASGFGGERVENVENVVVNNYYGDSAGSGNVQSADYSSGDDDSFSSSDSDDWT